MQSEKIHPAIIYDDYGVKFVFDHELTHYTIRFSGKPMFLMEEWYYHLGGKHIDFQSLHRSMSENPGSVSKEDQQLLLTVQGKLNEFLAVIDRINKRGKSPFSIYAQVFNPFRSQK